MNLKSISASVLVLALLSACSGASVTPSAPPTTAPTSVPKAIPPDAKQIPIATSTATPVSTQQPPTPLPQRTSTPVATSAAPSAGSTAEIPLLIVPSADGLQLFSAAGAHVQTFAKAQLSLGRNLSDGIVPSGGSVAFISGDNPMTPDREGSGPLMLNLLDTHTGDLKPITPLFSPKMELAIEAAAAAFERNDAIEAAIAIAENSDTLKWSPDGRYLAFIAAIDGPSSDVYSYDRESGQINRLTDGLNQAARLFWSPDSKWIVHEEVESFGTGAGWNVKAVWAAAPDGSGNRKLYEVEHSGDEVFVDWVSPDTFFVYSWTPMGLQNIRLVNLATGEAQHVAPDYPVQALAFDPVSQAQLMVVDDYTAQQNNAQGGLYLASPTKQPQFIAPGNWYDVRWLPHAQLFFAKGQGGVMSIALDGTVKKYDGENALPIDAPDGAWLLAWGDGNFTSPIGLRLYTPDGDLKRSITEDAVILATWSPDSAGVFCVSDGKLYYAAIPNGEPQMIEENATATKTGGLGWVTP